MWWTRAFVALAFSGLAFTSTAGPAFAREVCPKDASSALRYVDLFDGPPEDLAQLIPDVANPHSGYWQLAYIYKAGRFATVRCKYADGHSVDLKLPKVRRCNYRIDAQETLKLDCR